MKTPKKILESVLPDTSEYPEATCWHFWTLEANDVNVFSREYTGTGKTALDMLFLDYVLKLKGIELLQKYKDSNGDYKHIKTEFELALANKSMKDCVIDYKKLNTHIENTWKTQILFEEDKDSNSKKKVAKSV